jgi:hypothetical protein
MTKATATLIERFTRALGEPVSTPEPARYRVFRWDCPVCRAGESDPAGIYRPLAVDSDGQVRCKTGCSLEAIAAEVCFELDVRALLDSLGMP